MADRQAQNFVYAQNPDPKYCKKCHYCKQLIDKKAKICPFCRRSQPNGCLTVVGIIILITILCTFCHAITTDSTTPNETESNNYDTEPVTEPKQSETSEPIIIDKAEYYSSENMTASEYAQMHLNVYPYSYLDLIFQLEEGGGYSHEESVYAADNCGADWNENAFKAAKGFYETSSTNVEEIKQFLQYSQFTDEQIEYAISRLGQ